MPRPLQYDNCRYAPTMRVTSSTTASTVAGQMSLPPSYNNPTSNLSTSSDPSLNSNVPKRGKKVRMVSFNNQPQRPQAVPAHSPSPAPTCWAKVVQPFDRPAQVPAPPEPDPVPRPPQKTSTPVVAQAPLTPPAPPIPLRMPSVDASHQACSLLAGASKKRRCALCTKPLPEHLTRVCGSCQSQPPVPTSSTGAYAPPHLRAGSRGTSTLRVANLDQEKDIRATEAELRTELAAHCRAHVRRVTIPVSRETGGCRGVAFVEFSDPRAAQEAVESAAAQPWRLEHMVLALAVQDTPNVPTSPSSIVRPVYNFSGLKKLI